ncbi:hypothetical protein KA344_10655 [bacterium]|nr:hypothetical protein [bacterium]
MRLHKLVIFAMLLALLSILAVPTFALAHDYDSQQYTLEPLDGHKASMRDMAGPGLQLLTSKTKSSTHYVASNDASTASQWSAVVSVPTPKMPRTKAFNQTGKAKPLWLINQAMLI